MSLRRRLRSWWGRGPAASRDTLVHLGGPAPGDAPGPTVLGLHGYGADLNQLRSLVPLPPSVSYLGLPAPHPLRDGYGYGYFDVSMTATGRPHADPSSVDAALDRVQAQVQRLFERVGPVIVLGYSQGASLVLDALLTRSLPIQAAVALAGREVSPPRSTPAPHAVPVFVASGSRDPLISSSDTASTLAALEARGHRVTARVDPVAHVVARAAVRALVTWLSARGDPESPILLSGPEPSSHEHR